MANKIAVILCGSGFKDGSEIRESVGVLWALSRHQVDVHCFAPNSPQPTVVNCLTMEPMNETRNQLVEAARIARGKIESLDKLRASDFDGIIIPGGFGAATNLCNFSTKGAEGTVIPSLQQPLLEFFNSKKPIGAVCIAPAILALAFRGKEFELTVGAAGDASKEIEKLGHRHFVTNANEICFDKRNTIVTTPAYMHAEARLCDIFEGIRKLVDEVVKAI